MKNPGTHAQGFCLQISQKERNLNDCKQGLFCKPQNVL
ncbi:conserved hypothetical protein [delta proteobacterium NaphS2]|nr:conserved hypothetical protein [delta proteobacterium NaphS2]